MVKPFWSPFKFSIFPFKSNAGEATLALKKLIEFVEVTAVKPSFGVPPSPSLFPKPTEN